MYTIICSCHCYNLCFLLLGCICIFFETVIVRIDCTNVLYPHYVLSKEAKCSQSNRWPTLGTQFVACETVIAANTCHCCTAVCLPKQLSTKAIKATQTYNNFQLAYMNICALLTPFRFFGTEH